MRFVRSLVAQVLRSHLNAGSIFPRMKRHLPVRGHARCRPGHEWEYVAEQAVIGAQQAPQAGGAGQLDSHGMACGQLNPPVLPLYPHHSPPAQVSWLGAWALLMGFRDHQNEEQMRLGLPCLRPGEEEMLEVAQLWARVCGAAEVNGPQGCRAKHGGPRLHSSPTHQRVRGM